jgi:hypothetical protein
MLNFHIEILSCQTRTKREEVELICPPSELFAPGVAVKAFPKNADRDPIARFKLTSPHRSIPVRS